MSHENLSGAYALHQELSDLSDDVKELKKERVINTAAQWFFTACTWLIYFMFASASYAAPLWVLQHFFGINAENIIAIVVLTLFIFLFPTAMSLGKHAGYSALSKKGVSTKWISILVAFFISTGVYLESISASSQQQEKTYQQVENASKANPTANPVIIPNDGMSVLLVKAETTLARCKEKLATGDVKHCKGDNAAVESLKAQIKDKNAQAPVIAAATITAEQKAKEAERDSNVAYIGQMFAKVFNTTNVVGLMISVLIGTLIFELSHSATIYNDFKLRRDLMVMMELFKTAKAEYFQATGKEFVKTDFKETESINLSEMRENGDIKHFNERLRDNDVEVYEEPKRNPIGFMSHTAKVEPEITPKAAMQKPLTGMRLRDALRNGADVYGNKPLDSIIPTTGHGEALTQPTKPSLFARFSQVLDKRAKTHIPHVSTSIEPQLSLTEPHDDKAVSVDGLYVCTCLNCGEEFKATRQWQKFCSHARKRKPNGASCKDQYHAKQGNSIASRVTA